VRIDIGPATWDPDKYYPVDSLLDHRWVSVKVKGRRRNNGTRKRGTVRRVLNFLVRWEAPWQHPSNDRWVKEDDIRPECKRLYWGKEVEEFPRGLQLGVEVCSTKMRCVTDGRDSHSNVTNAITEDGGCESTTDLKTTCGVVDGGGSGWKATESFK